MKNYLQDERIFKFAVEYPEGTLCDFYIIQGETVRLFKNDNKTSYVSFKTYDLGNKISKCTIW